MKNFLFLLFFNLIFINNSYSSEKIAFIDIDYVINNSQIGLSAFKNIDEKRKKNFDELKIIELKLKEDEEKLIKTKNLISDEDFNTKYKILSENYSTYQSKRDNYIKELNLLRKNEAIEILKKINPILEKYISDNDIEIIFNKKDIVIAKSNYDITNFIIEILDKDFKR